MSSIGLPSRGQCIEDTDINQLCQCPSFASTPDQAGPHLSSPSIRAHVLPAHLRSVWTWYSCPPRLCFNVCASLPCDELRCILSEGRYSPVAVSVIMFMHLIADVPGTRMHMLGVSHRAYASRERISFAYASALRHRCPPFPCQRIHRRRDQHLVHSGTHVLSLH